MRSGKGYVIIITYPAGKHKSNAKHCTIRYNNHVCDHYNTEKRKHNGKGEMRDADDNQTLESFSRKCWQ